MLGRQNFQRLRELLKYIVSYWETRHSAIVTRYNALLATLNHIEDYIILYYIILYYIIIFCYFVHYSQNVKRYGTPPIHSAVMTYPSAPYKLII
jgi:hypothetical protein